jgi:Fic family protein
MENVLKAMALKQELDALRPLNEEAEARAMQKLRLDWNYHSNHLEGNSLSFGETKNLILHGITAQGKPLKDHFEITGHNEAINWVVDVVKENYPLTENFIRQLHQLLLKEEHYLDAITSDGKPTRKLVKVGQYKTSNNHVQTATGEIFYFASAEETPAKIHDLLEWYKNKKAQIDVNPLILAAEFHYKFVLIHPFDDGNGRVSRILMNFILMMFGYPPAIIKTEDKENYFYALREADNNNIEFFIDYITVNLIRSLEIMIAGAKGENIEEPDDIDKKITLLEQRLNSVGKKIEVFKSTKTLGYLFRSIKKIIDKFLVDNKKFNKFYRKQYIELFVNDKFYECDESSWYETLVNLSLANPDFYRISINYNFIGFVHKNFEEFSHTVGMSVDFLFNSYSIKYDNQNLKKYYDSQLSDAEITKIINFLLNSHQEYINRQVEDKLPEK